MVNQTSLEVNGKDGKSILLNYKNDGIYVAISLQRAAIYSAFNKFGSEILERCIILYKLLEKSNIVFRIPDDLNFFKIEKYLNYNPSPIIVEILKIDDDNLETEFGKKAKATLDYLRVTIPKMKNKSKFELLQFCNFKVVKFVEPKYLKFYKLEFEGHPVKGNFEFTLSKI